MASSGNSEAYYYYMPNMQAYDSTSREVDTSYAWVQPTIIEDEDLQFGGKSLSAWYEEERRRLSSGSDDGEERRGRERVRKHHSKSSKSHKK